MTPGVERGASAAQLLEARASLLVAHRKYLDAQRGQGGQGGVESAAAEESMQNTPATRLIASREGCGGGGGGFVCCTLRQGRVCGPGPLTKAS